MNGCVPKRKVLFFGSPLITRLPVGGMMFLFFLQCASLKGGTSAKGSILPQVVPN